MSAPVEETFNPYGVLDDAEAEQATYVANVGGQLTDSRVVPTVAIAAALGGAFLVYRDFMRRRLEKRFSEIDTSNPDVMAREIQNLLNTFMPAWQAMVGPVLLRGYLNGISETGLIMDSRFLTELADNYAYSLGQHINDVSAEALVKGYAAQVNRKVPAKIALANVVDAFGVTTKTGRALNNILSAKEDAKLSETLLPSVKKMRAKALVAAAVRQRADTIGGQESWNALQTGKQVVWLYAMRQGIIPETATRSWETALDERVCPYCGPMHKAEQVISEPFEMADGKKIWSPPVHPNCRCEVKLNANLTRSAAQGAVLGEYQRHWIDDDPEVAVAKAEDEWDPREHPRSQRSGRFVHANQREYATRTAEPDLQALVRDAELSNLLGGQKKTLKPVKSLAPEKKQLKRELKPEQPRKRLKGSGLGPGAGLNRGKVGRSKQNRAPLDRDKIMRDLKAAQARREGRIMARGDDIVLDATDVTEHPFADLQPTDVPMYAIIEHNAVRDVNPGTSKPKGRYFQLDGGEVVGDVNYLADKLRHLELETDYKVIEQYYEYGDLEWQLHMHGIVPDLPGEYNIDDDTLKALIGFVRDQRATGGAEQDSDGWMISVGVMGYVDGDGNIVDGDDPRWEAAENGETEDFDPEPDIIGYEPVSVTALIEALDVENVLDAAKPQIVRLNKVRGNDIAYDAKGVPYAQPLDTYRASEPFELNVNGEIYDGYHIEPAWDD